jgi:hypothetical protein
MLGRGAADTAGDPHPQGHHHRHDREAAEHANSDQEHVHDIASDYSTIRITM